MIQMPQIASILADTIFADLNPPQTQEARQAGNQADPARGGFFDNVLRTVFGNQDSDLTDEELSKRKARRREASQMAASAANGNPGEEYMNAPAAGSGSGIGLEDIARLFMGK